MSGVEIVGLVLGAFPLAVSAFEHYSDTKQAAGTFWKIKRAYRKDVRSLNYCETIFTLHLEELLQPMASVEIAGDSTKCAELLQNPGSQQWKSQDVEIALSNRLGEKRYRSYLDTMDELQTLMIQLAKETKVEDADFQRLLAVRPSNAPQTTLMHRANVMVSSAPFQARRLKYSLSTTSRAELLLEVERYIGRLRELVAAVDRLSKVSSEQPIVKAPPLSKILLHFWTHAGRIYRLLRKSMSCKCRSMHCARLWLRHHSEPQASLRMLLLFTKDSCQSPTPWFEQALQVKHIENAQIDTAAQSSPATPQVVLQPVRSSIMQSPASPPATTSLRPTKVTFAAPASPSAITPDLLSESLCLTLAKGKRHACLGALTDEHDQVQYQVFPEPYADTGLPEIVTAADLLKQGTAPTPPFYRAYRYGIAFKVAAAQIQYHSTPWLTGQWTLKDVRFLKRRTGIDYSTPYLLSHFECDPTTTSTSNARDQSFWTLGVVLLELCFGKLLEDHPLFADPSYPRNSKDPFQQHAVANEWAQDVELDADYAYSCVVKWCLQQSPAPGTTDWRKEFAQHVLQPLQRLCEPMKVSTGQI